MGVKISYSNGMPIQNYGRVSGREITAERERERQLRKVIRPSPLVRQADTPSVVVVRNKPKRRN